jgi:signal transduction histidine kinase
VAVLCVLQEALVNVRRHPDARRVEVVLLKDHNRVRAKVTDDGRGFNPDYSSPRRPRSSLNFRPTSESSL